MRHTLPAVLRQGAILLALTVAGPVAAWSQALPHAAAKESISVAFSPQGGGLALVLRAIRSAQRSIDVAAYSFTSADVARALADAARRGVQVRVLADRTANLEKDARYARHALSILQLAGIAVRTIDVYPIFHDKFMVIDGRSVQTGSFNYTYSAARRNAENVLVVWNDPPLAARYGADWRRNWALGRALRSVY